MDRRKFVTLAGIGGVVGAFSTQLLVTADFEQTHHKTK
jgi:hypothetical protein